MQAAIQYVQHEHQAVILVELCHIALLHAVDTQQDTPGSCNHLDHDSCAAGELTSTQSMLRLRFYAGWPNTWYCMPLSCGTQNMQTRCWSACDGNVCSWSVEDPTRRTLSVVGHFLSKG